MKKFLSLVLISGIFLSSAIFSAQAAYDFSKNSGASELGKTAGYDISKDVQPEYYVGLVLSIIFSLFGLIFLILTIYAGIKWMTAQGNNSQIESAKDTLTRAIIGLVICLLAYGITYFIVNSFQSDGVQFIDTPVQENSDANPSA